MLVVDTASITFFQAEKSFKLINRSSTEIGLEAVNFLKISSLTDVATDNEKLLPDNSASFNEEDHKTSRQSLWLRFKHITLSALVASFLCNAFFVKKIVSQNTRIYSCPSKYSKLLQEKEILKHTDTYSAAGPPEDFKVVYHTNED